MKLYLAGPMTGIENLNYPAFLEAEKQLTDVGFKVSSPHRIDQLFPIPCGHAKWDGDIRYGTNEPDCEDCASRTWHWYMRKAVIMLAECDNMAILPGWQRSRGAKAEFNLGVALGMDPLYVSVWLRAVESGRVKP